LGRTSLQMWRPKSCTQTLPIANNIWGNGGQCRTLHIYRTMTSTTTPENKTLTLNIGNDYNFLENVIAIIEQLDLEPLQKQFMTHRWLQQVIQLERLWKRYRFGYYLSRIVTIVGGVIVPALVSFNISSDNTKVLFGWLTLGLSQIVAISASLEEFLQYGKLYCEYRNSAELMKMEAWHFFQFSGPYKKFTSHRSAYTMFAGRVEKIIEQDLEVLNQVAEEQEKQEEQSFESMENQDTIKGKN